MLAVAKLVAVLDCGSSAERRVGSSPISQPYGEVVEWYTQWSQKSPLNRMWVQIPPSLLYPRGHGDQGVSKTLGVGSIPTSGAYSRIVPAARTSVSYTECREFESHFCYLKGEILNEIFRFNKNSTICSVTDRMQ